MKEIANAITKVTFMLAISALIAVGGPGFADDNVADHGFQTQITLDADHPTYDIVATAAEPLTGQAIIVAGVVADNSLWQLMDTGWVKVTKGIKLPEPTTFFGDYSIATIDREYLIPGKYYVWVRVLGSNQGFNVEQYEFVVK